MLIIVFNVKIHIIQMISRPNPDYPIEASIRIIVRL